MRIAYTTVSLNKPAVMTVILVGPNDDIGVYPFLKWVLHIKLEEVCIYQAALLSSVLVKLVSLKYVR